MSTQLIDHPPVTRCYRCGSPQIATVCHHCGRPMCREDTPDIFKNGKPISYEYRNLGLDGRRANTYHCLEHSHIVRGSLKKFVIAGAIVAAVGLLSFFISVVSGIVLVICGAGLAIGALLLEVRWNTEERSKRPPVPFFPRFDLVSISETLHGDIELRKDSYDSKPAPVKGMVKIVITPGSSDAECVSAYRSRYKLTAEDQLSYSAGFGVIQGVAGLNFSGWQTPLSSIMADGTVIGLGGDLASHPSYNTNSGDRAAQWALDLPYELHRAVVPENIPIWIIPSLVPASDHRTFELDLHWGKLSSHGRKLDLDRFELIELEVPRAWGNVESATTPYSIDNSSPKKVRKIVWKPQKQGNDQSPRQSMTLTARFEHKIVLPGEDDRGRDQAAGVDDREDLVLSGKFVATFKGTLSGIESIRAAYSGGGLLAHSNEPLAPPDESAPRQPRVMTRTEVDVNFRLSLSSIRYQDVRMVPDPAEDIIRREDEDKIAGAVYADDVVLDKAESEDFATIAASFDESNGSLPASGPERSSADGKVVRLENEDYPGVIPDFMTVIELTNAMSEDGYYVKRIVENQPSSAGRANLLNRYWDIAGRRYDGVFPIDFHLTLTGEEEYAGGIRARAGNSSAQLTVNGSYVTKEMREKIEQEWDTLYDRLDRKLKERATQAISAVPEQRLGSPQVEPRPAPSPAAPAAPPEPTSAAHDISDRIAALRKQLDAMRTAFLEGRMSEPTYREMKAEVEAELAALAASS
jgi:hypothetical protein